MQIDPYLTPYTKVKSIWIENFSINPETLNLMEEKMGNSLECIGTGDNYLKKNTIHIDTKIDN